jgi:hypothetical protein
MVTAMSLDMPAIKHELSINANLDLEATINGEGDTRYKVLAVDFYWNTIKIERNGHELFPVDMVTIIEKPKPEGFFRGWLCNVRNCGADYGCVHVWTGLYCPHCHYEMIRVTTSEYAFCSNPMPDNCDYSGKVSDKLFLFSLIKMNDVNQR